MTADDSHPPASRPTTTEILRRENDRLRHERTRLERELEGLARRNEELRRDREKLQREQERLEQELERVRQQNARLREALESARRAGKRQAAPFSKGAPKAAPKRPGRKSGAAHGRHAHRAVPTHVDEVIDAPVPPTCPDCHGEIIDRQRVSQYQEDLPPVRPYVREFGVEVGWCAECGRRVQGRHPLQTSDALGAAATQIGPEAIGLATMLHTQLGLPVAKVAALFRQTWHLSVTAGGIMRAIERVGQRAKPTYQALVTAINESPLVVPDETGWRENGRSCWEWVFATPSTTVYFITTGRGFADASIVLSADYAGTLVRDGWVAYREYDRARHQSCLGHLLNRCETLRTDHPHSTFAPAVQAILQAGLAARDRWRAGRISDHGAAVIRGQLVHQLDLVLDAPGPLADMRRFARHLDREFPHLFTFLTDLDIDATNYRAEQAIRPSVAIRKVCGGNRSPLGIETQYLLSSLLRTAVQRSVDIPATITTLLRSPVPIVPAGLRAPPC